MQRLYFCNNVYALERNGVNMKRQRVGKVLNIVVFVCVVLTFLLVFLLGFLAKDVFSYNTSINGVDCSFYSVDGAKNKLERHMNDATLELKFADDKEYTCIGSHFEIKSNSEKIAELLKSQGKENVSDTNYSLEDLYSVNEKKVKEYLSSLSVFRDSNIRKPQNATLEWNEKNQVYIKPEVEGNELSVDDAYEFMLKELKKGKTVIDFKQVTKIKPTILADDEKLIQQRDEINKIVGTTITYTLHDGSEYVLDSSVMKDWVKQGDDGYYSIELEARVSDFVDKLAKKAQYSLTSTKFNATGIGEISIAFGRKTYATVDKEKEIDRIKEKLEKYTNAKFEVSYNPLPNYKNISTYVELDLSRQRLWMYVNGNCIVNTPFVSGNVSGGYATPVGIYYLTYKTTNTKLEGYNRDGSKYSSPVSFWMPFNGGIGLHDATWRGSFGGNIYLTNGSHGCINLPYNAAKTIYQNIDTSIPIILYAS